MEDVLTPSDFSVILHFDPMMVAELALGADDPLDIAERYGVEESDYEHLAQQEWFTRLVAQKRMEYHDTGVLFTAKAGMMAEALLTRLFQQSMAGVIPAPLTIEVAKQLTDIGRLKPQPLSTTPGAGGGAFQINIQVNGSDVVAKQSHLVPAPIDAAPTKLDLPLPAPAPVMHVAGSGRGSAGVSPGPGSVAAPAVSTSPSGAAMTLPPKPRYISNLRVPDFDLRRTGLGPSPAVGAVPTPPLPPGLGVR